MGDPASRPSLSAFFIKKRIAQHLDFRFHPSEFIPYSHAVTDHDEYTGPKQSDYRIR